MAKSTSPLPTHGVPKLISPLGRGARGKSLVSRWMIERAHTAGRSVVIADADRTNPTLSTFFHDVMRPPSADDRDVSAWIEQLLTQLFLSSEQDSRLSCQTALIDLGGGDLVLKTLAAEMGIVQVLEGVGVDVVAIHMLGPDLDDLAYLRDLEHADLFAPKKTIIVLNDGVVPGHQTPATAFKPLMEHPILRNTLLRGARIISMPALKCVGEVDRRRLTFDAAQKGFVPLDIGEQPLETGEQPLENPRPVVPKALSLFDRQRVAKWMKSMEAAFEPVAEWLP